MAEKRILLIDDEPATRLIVQVTFKVAASWETLIAESYEAGIALAEAEQPDAILLDGTMPEIRGINLAQPIQFTSAIQNIPTILLTAQAQARERENFAQMAIAGVIAKPFKANELVSQVRSILGWYD
jgi:DNA-binding response OmpR family regulator